MRLYISLMKLTAKGLAELGDSPSRRRVSEERVAKLGGRSVSFYATLGTYDFVQLFEMPSEEAMLEYSLIARRDGYVDPLILPAFAADDFAQLVGKVSSI